MQILWIVIALCLFSLHSFISHKNNRRRLILETRFCNNRPCDSISLRGSITPIYTARTPVDILLQQLTLKTRLDALTPKTAFQKRMNNLAYNIK